MDRRRALADADWVRISRLDWTDRDDGLSELVIVTPETTLTETFSAAELEHAPDDEGVHRPQQSKLTVSTLGAKGQIQGLHPSPRYPRVSSSQHPLSVVTLLSD